MSQIIYMPYDDGWCAYCGQWFDMPLSVHDCEGDEMEETPETRNNLIELLQSRTHTLEKQINTLNSEARADVDKWKTQVAYHEKKSKQLQIDFESVTRNARYEIDCLKNEVADLKAQKHEIDCLKNEVADLKAQKHELQHAWKIVLKIDKVLGIKA